MSNFTGRKVPDAEQKKLAPGKEEVTKERSPKRKKKGPVGIIRMKVQV